MALVYGYVPYLILPLFASLDRIDQRLIEAARDLGAPPPSAFWRVVLPLSKTGIMAGVVLIALDDTATDYDVLVRASFAPYLVAWLLDAAIEHT